MVNRVTLVGNLGRDIEQTTTAGGFPIGRFSMATSSRRKNGKSGQWEEKTEWHRIVLLGDRWEGVSQYLLRGKTVYVEGEIETRSWEDKDGQKRYMTEIIAHRVQLLGGGRDRDEGGGEPRGGGGRSRGRGGERTRAPREPEPEQAPGSEWSHGGDDAPAGDLGPDDDDVPF